MAVPKRRTSKSRQGTRRSHDAKQPRQLAKCPGCSTPVPAHVICPVCGQYMGRKVVDMEAAKKKKKKK